MPLEVVLITHPPAWSRDWSASSDFDAPTGPIPVQEPPQSGGFSTGRKIAFAIGLLPIILLGLVVILVSNGIDPLGDIVIDLRWIPWPS